MNPNSIPVSPETVNRVQTLLGWRHQDLLEVVDSMVLARNSCTENDAPGAPGMRAYFDGTRRLREVGCQHPGWEASNDHNIATIYNRERGLRIAVCNSDDGTGVMGGQPQNRSKKGSATEWAVNGMQLTLDLLLDEATNVIAFERAKGGVQIWYLYVYASGDSVRAELSYPSKIENGFFVDYYERIILIGSDEDQVGMVQHAAEQGADDLEINVTRKRA